MMKEKCLKNLSEKDVYEMIQDVDEKIVGQYECGGRTHYEFICPACGTVHVFAGIEHGVVPNQPALGWL